MQLILIEDKRFWESQKFKPGICRPGPGGIIFPEKG